MKQSWECRSITPTRLWGLESPNFASFLTRKRPNEVRLRSPGFRCKNSSFISVFFFLILLIVTDEELQRLRLAFKRASGVSGLMVETLFAREVLGDCVPVRVAEVISYPLRVQSQTVFTLCRTFKYSLPSTNDTHLLLCFSANLHCLWRDD